MYSATHRFRERSPGVIATRFLEREDHMFDDKVTGIGFLKTTKARHAEEAIGHTEGLVTVLRLTMADIKPAEDALKIAKQFSGRETGRVHCRHPRRTVRQISEIVEGSPVTD